MKKMQNMSGFFVAAVTPFDEAGKFSASALHKLMDKTIAEGAKGFLIGGSSAECPLLTHAERVEGLEAAAKYQDRTKTKLIASVAAISTDEAVEYAKTAKELGYDAMIAKIGSVDALQLFNFVPFQELLLPMVATFAAAGMFVGIVGSWTSIRKFMDV